MILLFAFVGGITTVTGALIAGTAFALLLYAEQTFPDFAGVVFIAVGAAAIGLGRQPNGLAGLLFDGVGRAREALDRPLAASRAPRPATGAPAPALAVRGDVVTRAVTAARIAAGLVAASSLLGGPAGPARRRQAQTPASPTLAGVQGRALASGVAVAYQPEGLLPIASPIDLSSPDALATIASGPSTFARASAADPGDLLANPDALLALGSPDYEAGHDPALPLPGQRVVRRRRADGRVEPGARPERPRRRRRQRVDRRRRRCRRWRRPAVATAGSIASIASTTTDGATVTVHARTEVSNFDLLGILTIESLVTDVTATSDGDRHDPSPAARPITGAAVLGQPVTIDADGVHGEPPSGPPTRCSATCSAPAAAAPTSPRRRRHPVTLVGPVAQDGETAGQLTAAGLRIVLEVSEDTMPVLGQLAGARAAERRPRRRGRPRPHPGPPPPVHRRRPRLRVADAPGPRRRRSTTVGRRRPGRLAPRRLRRRRLAGRRARRRPRPATPPAAAAAPAAPRRPPPSPAPPRRWPPASAPSPSWRCSPNPSPATGSPAFAAALLAPGAAGSCPREER